MASCAPVDGRFWLSTTTVSLLRIMGWSGKLSRLRWPNHGYPIDVHNVIGLLCLEANLSNASQCAVKRPVVARSLSRPFSLIKTICKRKDKSLVDRYRMLGNSRQCRDLVNCPPIATCVMTRLLVFIPVNASQIHMLLDHSYVSFGPLMHFSLWLSVAVLNKRLPRE